MAKRSNSTLPRARTEEVAPPVEQPQIDPKWQRHLRRLLALRDELLRRREDLVKDATEEQPAFSLHIADAGTDNYDRDFALSMISSEQNAFYEVEEALRRIRDGEYGICEVTGKPIEPDRLNAIPWTRFCRDAEKQLEQQGAIERRRLGTIKRTEESPAEEDEEEVPKE